MVAWFGILALVQDSSAVRFQYEVDNLKPGNARELQSKLRSTAGVAECVITGIRVTLVVKAGESVKISDLLALVRNLRPEKDEKIAVKLDSIKLEGKVTLSFSVEKNPDRVHGALNSISNIQTAKKVGDTFECVIKAPGGVKLGDVAKAVVKATESGDVKTADVVRDVVWHGAPAAAAKSETPAPAAPNGGSPPGAAPPPPTPPPSAPPPAAKPPPPKPPAGKKPGG